MSDQEKEAAMELFLVVCHAGGIMELSEAVSSLSRKNRLLVQHIGRIKFVKTRFKNIFKVLKSDQASSKSEVKVEAMVPIKFCAKASQTNGCPDGESCVHLHLCPYFIKGKCSYKTKCRCSHDIKDRHTTILLSALDLESIDDETWIQLLRKIVEDTSLERGASSHDVPEICKFYNNQGGCRMSEKCPFLHVCRHFIDGTCKFGEGCKRDHVLLKDKHNRDVFQKFGLGSANPTQLLYILRGRERKRTSSSSSDSSLPGELPHNLSSTSLGSGQNAIRNGAPIPPRSAAAVAGRPAYKFTQTSQAQAMSMPEGEITDICGFFLRGQCNYGQKCKNLHRDLPYQWQIKDPSIWKDLSEDTNIMLERSYSNPSNNAMIFYCQGHSFKTDFDKMVALAEQGHAGPLFQLRRLSTESSAEAPPGHIFSTRWLWYWEDEKNAWQSYDSPDDGIEPNTTYSKSLEKDFLQGKDSHPFSAGHHKYTLFYKRMVQKNDLFQTERAVRRRPEFVAKERMKEIEQRRKEMLKTSLSRASETSVFPSHWEPMLDNKDYVKVPLESASQEYKDIQKKFQETFPEAKKIKKIERIQNHDLWTQYTQKKGRMAKKANDTPPKEMPQLFHGTASDVLEAICQQGFDWRMCGKHGTLYGKGSYFSSSAIYSHRYTERGSNGSYCYMFVARVLVGSYAVGDKLYTRPPSKDPDKPHGDLYDSCVNDTTNPSLFVVFDNSQSYPEYLITYKA